ncbi:MAG: aminotransferase class V [Chloroflexus sp.]|uniref:aminotransferase class V-fold PLP-dependent enzyme n=1 Tax=Chloroflexus sp. TaxID=1904827 RepID=UPI0021DBBE2B|nr:aminotransferase class V-fold PLP-dependent enzyme [Chloroflexus sp.]GIV88338.1 MAG: aminotransferase class V [Chloroflexus sp.]
MTGTTLSLPLPTLAEQFLLRRDITFLNHGSFGACPRPVFTVYQAWQRQLEAQPVAFLGRELSARLHNARTRLAAFVGASADELVFVPNVTYALNIVARSIDLQPGDEVLGTTHEYGAIERTWQYVCRQRGATYVNQPVKLPVATHTEIIDQLWSGVTPRTRVILLSHITSPTALIMPVAEICRRARAAGIITVIDGAHAPGQIDLNLTELGADFYGANCHKWLCAPKGAGFLYVRPEHQTRLEPLVVSWGWQPPEPLQGSFLAYPTGRPLQAYYEWMGTDDPSAFLSVPAAIDFQQTHHWPAVRNACHTLLREASTQILELSGLPPLSPADEQWWGQMRALPLPPCDPTQVQARLWHEWRVEVPCFMWEGQPLIRVSVQAYNSPTDIDRLLSGLRAIMS